MSAHDVRRNAIVAFVAVFVFVPLGWMLMDREPPYTFQHVDISPCGPPPTRCLQTEIHQGSEIYITFHVRENRAPCSPGMVYREYKEASGKLHLFDPIQRAEAPIVVDNKFTRISKLPDNISPGPTTYRGLSCYTCNYLHRWLRWPVCASTPPATFNIIEKPNSGARQ